MLRDIKTGSKCLNDQQNTSQTNELPSEISAVTEIDVDDPDNQSENSSPIINYKFVAMMNQLTS